MKSASKGIVLLGLFFLILGTVWLKVIYIRAKAGLPAGHNALIPQGSPAVAYRELKTDMQETLSRQSVIDRYASHRRDKTYVKLFWIIALVEVICSFLYIFAGIALLRLYHAGRLAVFLTLYFDVLFKSMVMVYMNYYALPLENVLQGQNILYSYFLPHPSWLSTFSTYVTGLGFYQPKGALFLFIYLVYLFGIFYFLTQPSIKKQFAK
jgi:hypothetical protein